MDRYTGSAGWFYQLITESFIGLQKNGNKLGFVPCVPEEWSSLKFITALAAACTINFVRSVNTSEAIKIEADGISISENFLR